jgi:hypothetical protein
MVNTQYEGYVSGKHKAIKLTGYGIKNSKKG